MVCTNDAKEKVFSTAKIFTVQEVIILLQGNANKMPVYLF
jgi:hypothetical protein